MIAIILAAGKGSRISEISKKPKSFLKLNNYLSIIDYQVKMLESINVKKIYIVVGYKKKLFEKKFSYSSNVQLIFNKNWYKSNVLESFSVASKCIKNNFIFLHADALIEKGIYKIFKKEKKICLIYKRKKCGDEEMKLYKLKNYVFLSKEYMKERLMGEFTGLVFIPYIYLKIIKNVIKNLKKDKNYKKFFFEEVLNILSKNYKINFNLFDIGKKNFVEVDYKEDYFLAEKLFGSINYK